MGRPKKYDRARNEIEGLRIDRAIAGAKAAICIRRFRSSHVFKWLDLAEIHLTAVNGYLREVDRVSTALDDVVGYVGAKRRESQYG